MRLFTKIFLCGTLVFGLAFSGAGYFLLRYSLESSLFREVDFALTQYQYDKFTVQAALLTYADSQVTLNLTGNYALEGKSVMSFWRISSGKEGVIGGGNSFDRGILSGETDAQGESSSDGGGWQELTEKLFRLFGEEITAPIAFFNEDKSLIYSEIEGLDPSFLNGLSENAHVFRFWDTPGGSSILVGSVVVWDMWGMSGGRGGGEDTDVTDAADGICSLYFVTQWDISKTVGQQDTMRQVFFRCYALAMAVGMAMLGFLSAFLSRPLKRMSGAARRMARGDYQERLAVRGRDEIGELAESFNQMAGAVEEKIQRLRDAAREKEDFVANFAHELKTPLTSIIGYADMLYQRELPREEVRKSSWYIWNEGMRLEALSLKLMDLIVLGRQEFILQEMPAQELLRDVSEGLWPLFLERQVELSLRAEAAYIRVDYDLFKTLLINLVDNSLKAGSRRIDLSGEIQGEEYRICVRDDGCGIPEEELSRITEAFYMVDKARSRKQHGAGLGLALAERIARIHGCGLVFESGEGRGTAVSFRLKCEKGGMEDGEK